MAVRTILIDLAVMLAVGVALTLLGPFGSYAAPFALRLLYWLLLCIGGYCLYAPVIRGADLLAARIGLPAAGMWVAGWLAASAPMAAIVWFANSLWAVRTRPSLDAVATLYGDVLVVAGIACLILWFLTAHRRGAEAPTAPLAVPADPAAAAPAPSRARLLERLPPHLGEALVALEMEDHYARAHTGAGSTLLLMRMRDAVAELDGVEGAQVHRSWWVARAAVTGVVRDGRNLRLKLANGLEAPVARGAVPALKAAGWFR